MKTVIIIPTYWTREREKGVKFTDIPHDHPTPLDEGGTLERAILSLEELEDRDFTLVVIATASFEFIEELAEIKVVNLLKKHCPTDIQTYVFSHRHIELLKKYFKEHGGSEFLRLIDIHGYSNMRNLTQIIAQLLDAELMISVDDDEYFNDPAFLKKARENINRVVNGKTVDGIGGYYINPSGGYQLPPAKEGEWLKYWNKTDAMNRAFDKFIGQPPRLKLASFAFGGCMVYTRRLMENIPFDPLIPRGEDIDYLINARLFGFNLFLDNDLWIVHDPPSKPHPLWRGFMVDAIRYTYDREKLLYQEKTMLRPEDLDPYPGEFLKEDLDEKIKKASVALFEEYLAQGEEESAEMVLDIPRMARQRIALNPYTHLKELKKTWEDLSAFIRDKDLRAHKEFLLEI